MYVSVGSQVYLGGVGVDDAVVQTLVHSADVPRLPWIQQQRRLLLLLLLLLLLG